jgi:adenine deaminase
MMFGISTHLSLQAMVKYGMTPYEALRTATYFPAKTMGVADDLGTIEPGKLADLVFVKGNPLQDIKDSTNVQMVMKYGNIYTVDELISPYNQDNVDISTSDIKTLIEKFKEEGEFESDSAARSLTIRVTAVSHYEEKEQAKKVIKHMKGFKQLLEHQRENKLISEKAYNALKEDADSLIKKWQ